MSNTIFKTAPHNPPHFFVTQTTYMLTASIYERIPMMKSSQRKAEWRDAFHETTGFYQWQIVAWTVLHNHYYAIVISPEHASSLPKNYKFSNYGEYLDKLHNFNSMSMTEVIDVPEF